MALFICAPLYAANAPNDTASDATTEAQDEPAEPRLSLLEPLDRHRNFAAKSVTDFATWLDTFFGDERMFDETQDSRLKLNLIQTLEDGRRPTSEVNLQGKLKLPNTQKNFDLLFESSPDEDATTDDTIIDSIESREQSVALRYTKYATDWLRANTDAGIRFRSGKLDSFVRFRMRGIYTADEWLLRASQSVFWRDSTGPGAITQFDIERRVATSFLIRSASEANWLDETRQFNLGQNFYLIHTINKHQGIIYRVGLTAISEPNTHTTSYFASIQFRQQLHRDWLFFEVSPRVIHPLEDDFHAQHSITFKLEVIFGGA